MVYIKRAAEDTIAPGVQNVSCTVADWPKAGWQNDLIAKTGRGTTK